MEGFNRGSSYTGKRSSEQQDDERKELKRKSSKGGLDRKPSDNQWITGRSNARAETREMKRVKEEVGEIEEEMAEGWSGWFEDDKRGRQEVKGNETKEFFGEEYEEDLLSSHREILATSRMEKLAACEISLADYNPGVYEDTTHINNNGIGGLKQVIRIKNKADSNAKDVTLFVYGYAGEGVNINRWLHLRRPDIDQSGILSADETRRLIRGRSSIKKWEVVDRKVIIDNSFPFQGIRLPHDIEIEEKEINRRNNTQKPAFTLWHSQYPELLANVYWQPGNKTRNLQAKTAICEGLNSLVESKGEARSVMQLRDIENLLVGVEKGKKVMKVKDWLLVFTESSESSEVSQGEIRPDRSIPPPENGGSFWERIEETETRAATPANGESFWDGINDLNDIQRSDDIDTLVGTSRSRGTGQTASTTISANKESIWDDIQDIFSDFSDIED